MKKLIIFPLLALLFFASCTSQRNVNNFYNKYQGTENTMSMKAPLFLASLMMKNQAEAQKFRDKVKSVRILSMSDLSETKNANVQQEVKTALHSDGFENWFNVNKNNSVVNVSAKNRGKSLRNIVISFQGADNLIFLNAKTDLSEQELTNFITNFLDSKK